MQSKEQKITAKKEINEKEHAHQNTKSTQGINDQTQAKSRIAKKQKSITEKNERDSDDQSEEDSEDESNSNSNSDASGDEYSDNGQTNEDVESPSRRKKKKKNNDEEDEKIIDNQFPKISMFEKDNSFLGTIISSCDEFDSVGEMSSSEESPSEESANEASDGENSPVKPLKRERLMLNIAYTQYPIIKECGKLHNMKITRNDEADWDLIWLDACLPPEKMLRMKSHQKGNHYPGMYGLCRKNHLGRNLMKMMKQFPNDYRFFPRTWLLPYEMVDFKMNFNSKGKSKRAFIVKPEALSQGEGIFLTKNINKLDPDEHCVAQEYIHRPYLIDDLKFDLRIYAMVYGVEPLRIYLYKEGLARFATSQYSPPSKSNMNNMFMHLTNYAINKNSDDFIFNEEESVDDVGHKRSLSAVLKQLEDEGNDPNLIMNRISDIIIKTIITVQPSIAHQYKTLQPEDCENSMIFEVLGFDILLDYKCRPWLLEVNGSPSFTTDTPLDRKIKKGLISDTIKLLNLSEDRKQKYKRQQQENLMSRMRTGKQIRMTQEERQKLKEEKEIEREIFESQNMGKYILLYPLNDKLKEYLKSEYIGKEIIHDDNEVIPDQSILSQVATIEKRLEDTTAKGSEEVHLDEDTKQKSYKKKQVKEVFDGDIYKKYLRKASTLWEDFTTGK